MWKKDRTAMIILLCADLQDRSISTGLHAEAGRNPMKRVSVAVVVALFVLCVTVSGADAGLTGRFEEAPLRDWLASVGKQAGVEFDLAENLPDPEPLTLEVQDVSLEELLYIALRPRGMEAVRTAEKTYEVVRVTTPEGMTKRAGRSMVILRRLEAKLEEARRKGDEVVVPGWRAEESRRGIGALADFFGAVIYFENDRSRVDTRERNDRALELLGSPDRLVRIGAAIPMLTGYARVQPGSPGFEDVRERLGELVRSEDPHQRAAATFSSLVPGHLRRRVPDFYRRVVEAGLEDEAAEVRFAAALGLLDNRRVRGQFPQFADLAEDPSAAVRVVVRTARMFEATRKRDGTALADSLEGLLEDPNPIARSITMPLMATMLGGRDRYREEVETLLDGVDDPWTGLWAGPVRAAIDGDFAGVFNSVGGLLGSDKPSHRTLAALTLFVGRFVGVRPRAMRGGGDADWQMPDLSHARASEQPLVSLAAWSATSPAEADEDLRAEMRRMLESGPEHRRLGVLIASFRPRREEPAEGFREILLRILSSPRYVERFLAAQAISRGLSFEDALALMRQQIRRGDAQNIRMLLDGARSSVYRGGQEERAERVRKLTELILTEGGPELQVHYLTRFSHLLYQHGREEEERPFDLVFELADPHALLRFMERGRFSSHYIRQSFPALLERLKTELQEGSEETKTVMLDVISELFASGRMHLRSLPEEAKDAANELLVDVIEATFGREDGDRRAGVKLLAGLFPPSRSPMAAWGELPQQVQDAAADAVELVESPDAEIAEYAAEVLGSLYRQSAHRRGREGIADRADLEAAMEKGREWVQQNGTPTQRVHLLVGLAQHHQHRDQAARGLQQRLLEGQVPDDLQVAVFDALRRAGQDLEAEFVDYCLELMQDADEDRNLRYRAGMVLTQAARQARRDNDEPDWFERAAELGWKLGTDPDDPARHQGLQLYAQVAGEEEAAKRLKQLVLDADADEQVRTTAAAQLPRFAGEVEIYPDVLKVYDELPPRLAYQLAVGAARSKDAEGAEALVIKALRDEDLEDHQRSSICFSLQLPETQDLRQALEELQGNERINRAVEHVMQRWDRAQRQARQAARTRRAQTKARVADYDAQVKQLDEEAKWKKPDSVDDNLTWYARKDGGVAVADSEKKRVISPGKLLGHQNVRVNDLAFGKDKVWLATNIGLVSWDREMRYWSLMATGGGLGVPVKAVELKAGRLRVTDQPEDGKKAKWERTAEGGWKRVEAKKAE